MNEIEEVLQHYGIKGMRWGIRRSEKQLTRVRGQNGDKKSSRIKEEINSLKRERQWSKSLKEMDNLSTNEINKLSNRIRLENDLKRLSKTSKVATKNDKEDYRKRENLSDKELNDKVNRLRAKDNLHRNITDASKEQKEIGSNIVKAAAGVGLKYAITGKVTSKDIGMAALYPKEALNKKQMVNMMLTKTDKTLFEKKKD